MPVDPATLADLDRVVELWLALAAEQRTHGAHLTAEPNRDLLRETLAQRVVDRTCLVATVDGERSTTGEDTPADGATSGASIVGFVSFAPERDGLDRDVTRGVVENLYLEPAARGRGLGTALLEAAEEALWAVGADRVVLEALAANESARSFYEARGYELHRVTYERPTE